MRIVVLPEAAHEFEDAADYYDEQEAGLGLRYRDEVDRHIRWIAMHPAGLTPRRSAGEPHSCQRTPQSQRNDAPHMNRTEIYERRHVADRMEVLALVASIIGLVASVFMILTYGWLIGIPCLLLTFVCHALSRIFNLLSGLFAGMHSGSPSGGKPVSGSHTQL
ncbi:MAG: hypothetical protein KF833_07930 [Verrucomicrobiae bacterium]|nr:hypothetical protein [Verrucomicrobiae bacterium]